MFTKGLRETDLPPPPSPTPPKKISGLAPPKNLGEKKIPLCPHQNLYI